MKTGIISSAYFKTVDYENGMKKMKSHGYDCYDYQEIMHGNCDFYKMSEEELKKYFSLLLETSERTGLKCNQMHAVWPADYSNKEAREYSFSTYYKKGILASAFLGCKNLVVHPIMPYGMAAEPVEEWNGIIEMNIEFFTKLMPYAEEKDVNICIENMPFKTHALASTPSIKKLVTDVNHPNFKICFDTGHANVFHENIYDDLIMLGDDLEVLHVHDNSGSDTHNLPFFGNINWDDFKNGLRAIVFDKVLSLETNIPAKYPEPYKEVMQKQLALTAKYLAN